MEFNKGDLVRVQGFGNREAVLRVWERRERGAILSSEDGYERLEAGEEAPMIGFPMRDIRERIIGL
jgi:hypothetical protein